MTLSFNPCFRRPLLQLRKILLHFTFQVCTLEHLKLLIFFLRVDLEIPEFHKILFYAFIFRIETFSEEISITRGGLSWR